MENFEKHSTSLNKLVTSAFFFFHFNLIDVCDSPHPAQSDFYPASNPFHSVSQSSELDFIFGGIGVIILKKII